MNTFLYDLRYGIRLLRKNPAFTAVALAMLALGIGANTAIFQLINSVSLRSLPVLKPEELVQVKIADTTGIRGSWESWYATATNPLWEQIRKNQQCFDGVFAWGSERWVNLTSGGEPRFARAIWVSGQFFDTLGVSPIKGRVLNDDDDRRGAAPLTVISYSFWQREFGGDPSVTGKSVKLEGHPFEIIGVAPPSFLGLEVGDTFDVALPISCEPIIAGGDDLNNGTDWWLSVVGRLKPGWSIDQAKANLNSISNTVFADSLTRNYPAEDAHYYLGFKLTAVPAKSGVSQLRESYNSPLWILLVIAGLVLLIACANLANLMLARASGREREIAVRIALGASRRRLITQLLSEGLILAVTGAALGVLIAGDLSGFIVSYISTVGSPLTLPLEIDWRVMGFAAIAAMLTCALFGLTPAIRVTRLAPNDVLKSGSRGLTASRERYGLRRILIVTQVALSLVLVVSALMFSKSLRKLVNIETGFNQNGLMVVYANPAELNMPQEQRVSFKNEILEKVRGVPGIESAAVTSVMPLSGGSLSNKVWLETEDQDTGSDVFRNTISPDYFRTLGSALAAGRDFDDRDHADSTRVAIINESFARLFFKGSDPIGKRFWVEATPTDPKMLFEIVGVTKDARYRDLREEMSPVFFMPMSQSAHIGSFTQLLLRSSGDSKGTLSAVQKAINQVNPSIVVTSGVFRKLVEDSLLRERLMALLSGFFGFLALLLACIGLYGIMSYNVAGRTCEIGVRMALGAQPRSVLWLIMREIVMLVGAGIVIGLVGAFAVTSVASSLLFGLSAVDPISIGIAVLTMISIAAIAGYVPAKRAIRVDPLVALRYE